MDTQDNASTHFLSIIQSRDILIYIKTTINIVMPWKCNPFLSRLMQAARFLDSITQGLSMKAVAINSTIS